MHAYERQILAKLTLSPVRRFSDLRPKGLANNLFIYHLKKLTSGGLIRKSDKGYELTAQGNRYIDKLTLANFQPRFQPKIVTLIICRNSKREYLLYRRKRQPFFGLTGFPYGKIHFGESIMRAAARELKEKTGLSAKLTHRGDVYLTVHNAAGELITHMLAHVFSGTDLRGEILSETEINVCFWQTPSSRSKTKFIPGFKEILAFTAKSKNKFFKELNMRD